MKYKLHGLCLESDVELTGLPVATSLENPDVVFELRAHHGEPRKIFPEKSRTLAIPLRGDEWFVELYQLPTQSVMRFHSDIDFWISSGGSHIVCCPSRDVPPDLIQQYLLGWVLSLVLHLRHMVGLHASAVIVNGKAVGFVGSSGAGKSTLVAALAMAGCALLTDEVLVFKKEENGIYAMPGYREIRLVPEMVPTLENEFGHKDIVRRESNGKLALLADEQWTRVCQEPSPLGSLYLLTGDEQVGSNRVVFTAIDPKDAPRHLLRHSFVIPKYYRDFLNRQFAMLCQLCSRVPIRSLTFPRDVDQLPQVVDAILEYESQMPPIEGLKDFWRSEIVLERRVVKI